MAELLIIADDLTGAIEAGVQLRKKKVASRVVSQVDSDLYTILNEIKDAAVVVNTESRHLSPDKAAGKVRQVIQTAEQTGIKHFYKKTDSTLRGNIGAELEAFLVSTNRKMLPYIPGHPRVKRFTRKGFQYIDKTLLHETGFADDPLEPVTCSFIPDVLKKQTGLDIRVATADEINTTDKFMSKKEKIVLFDCNSADDLYRIGQILKQMNWLKALAGTAAMVEVLPEILSLPTSETENKYPGNPVLFINGSLNKVSLQQVNFAQAHGITAFVIPTHWIGSQKKESGIKFQRFIKAIGSELNVGHHAVLTTSEFEGQKISGKSRMDYKQKFPFQSVSELVGNLANDIMKATSVSTLAVFGGDTLNGILKVLGCKDIKPLRELCSGVALALASTTFGEIYLITKPGGYGEKDEILKILNQVKDSER